MSGVGWGRGGGTSLYKPYGYVPPQKVGFFAPFWSENRYRLGLEFLSARSETKATIFHTWSLNFFYQYPTYTPTIQDMQPNIIIMEYILEQIMKNFHLIFLPLNSGSRYLSMSLKLLPPNLFRAHYERNLLSEQ